ncbi:hypothetical protein OF83DRAFT_1124700 [Amylostereum chailletii]|nr:hypothetical protein OF83DRAFT_1124700 [Amylostereum chailletii]
MSCSETHAPILRALSSMTSPGATRAPACTVRMRWTLPSMRGAESELGAVGSGDGRASAVDPGGR